jgi:Tfp pilus assembly protein PilO/Tfp pilus assembly protein PilN
MDKHFCNGRKPFYIAVFSIIGVVLAACLLIYFAIESVASYQERRNEYLSSEVAVLDKQIDEIEKLRREQKKQLLVRKTVFEALNNARLSDVKLLNFLASNVPQGVQLTHVTFNRSMLELHGLTQSSEGVAKLMRRMEEAQFLVKPTLVSMTETGNGSRGLQEFKMTAKVDPSAKPIKESEHKQTSKAITSEESRSSGRSAVANSESSETKTLGWLGLLLGGIGLVFIFLIWRHKKFKTTNPDDSFIKRVGVEFATLDPQDLSTWGLIPRVAVLLELLVLMVVLSWLLIAPAWDGLVSSREKESILKNTFYEKKRESVNLDLIKKQLIDTQEAFGVLLKALPDHFDSAGFVSSVQKTAQVNGISIKKVEVGTESARGPFAELPIQFRFSGTFDSLGSLVADLSNHSVLTHINNFELSSDGAEGNKGRAMKLRFDANISIYRYLDEVELAAQKRSAKPVGAKK